MAELALMITNCGVGIVTEKELPPRREHDFYPTDLGTVERTLAKFRGLPTKTRHYQYPRRVLDPGAGSGNWGRGCRDMFPLADITGVELRDIPKPPDYNEWLIGDYPTIYTGMFPAYNLVMGNPPFKLAEEFVRTSLPVLHKEGHILFLLRLSFLEGQSRRDGLFTEHPPKYVWICSKRPSFQEDGKTNATAFAIYVWQKDWFGRTEVDWLR